MENTVFWGLVTACLFAIWPTRRSPSFVNPTTDGVVLPPSEFGITTGSPPSITATTEFVVPRSMPITLSAIAPSQGVKKIEVELKRLTGLTRARSQRGLVGRKVRAGLLRQFGRFRRVIRIVRIASGSRSRRTNASAPH